VAAPCERGNGPSGSIGGGGGGFLTDILSVSPEDCSMDLISSLQIFRPV
jgi:hypothetical protein